MAGAMAISAPWETGGHSGASAGSGTLNISGAPNGQVLIVVVSLSNIGGFPFTVDPGWKRILASYDQDASLNGDKQFAAYWKLKGPDDTQVTISWGGEHHQFVMRGFSYPGLDTTHPIEGVQAGIDTTGNTTVYSPAVSPTLNNRWVVVINSTYSSVVRTWTEEAALVERYDAAGGTEPYPALLYADTNGPVSGSDLSYQATISGGTPNYINQLAFALVPGPVYMTGSQTVEVDQTAKANATLFMHATQVIESVSAGDALQMVNTLPLPDIKTWLNGDDHDADTLNAQWRDPMLWLLKDTCPQLHAEYDGAGYAMTSPQALKFDTVTMQRGDIQFTPTGTKVYITVPGLYEGVFQGAVQLSAAASNADFATEIRVNGSVIASRMDDAITTESGLQTGVQGFGGHFFSVRLNIGDYVEFVMAGNNWGGKVKSSDVSVNSIRYATFFKMWWAAI